MLTNQQRISLGIIAQAAVKSEKETGLPAELTAAQCVFESAWLQRAPGNNCFGIMPDHHGSGVQYCVSKEFLNGTWRTMDEAFEKYDSLGDCFVDHARLITQGAPYALAWAGYQRGKNLDQLIARIGPIYATDPDYAEKIRTEAHSLALADAIKAARVML